MTKTNAEPRYVGTNWDEVKVEEKNGARGSMARKVITRGEFKVDAGELIAKIIAKLRQGYDVRLVDGKGEEAIRLYPCVAKCGTHMQPCIRPMGGFKSVLDDKKVEIRQPGGSKAKDEDEEASEGVTPDVMMTCEVCGHRQRVGRKR